MKRIIAILLALCLALSAAACSTEKPLPTAEPTPTMEDSYKPVSFLNHGVRITVASMPEKVVTAGPNCTEVFCALGLGDKVIGKSMENHSNGALARYKDAVDAIPTLSVGYPTAQQIIDSGCEFLYASSWIFNDKLSVTELEKAGITVYVSEASDFDSLFAELRDIGKVFLSGRTEQVISEQNTQLEAVKNALGEITEPKTVFVLDSFIGDKLFTAGNGNIETACIETAGGVNIFAELEKPWDAVEKSELIALNPEYIVIHDYSGSEYDAKVTALKADPELNTLDAVQNERFIRLSLEDIMPGMRSVPTVQTLAKALYAEKFN